MDFTSFPTYSKFIFILYNFTWYYAGHILCICQMWMLWVSCHRLYGIQSIGGKLVKSLPSIISKWLLTVCLRICCTDMKYMYVSVTVLQFPFRLAVSYPAPSPLPTFTKILKIWNVTPSPPFPHPRSLLSPLSRSLHVLVALKNKDVFNVCTRSLYMLTSSNECSICVKKK